LHFQEVKFYFAVFTDERHLNSKVKTITEEKEICVVELSPSLTFYSSSVFIAAG